MAKQWEIGDMVMLQQELCVLTGVSASPMGYKLYRVQSLDTGEFKTVHKHELSELVLEDLVDGLVTEWDTNVDSSVAGVPEVAVPVVEVKNPGRFADMSDAQLDDVAKSRLSVNTENQTRWAVRLYKGKCLCECTLVYVVKNVYFLVPCIA